MKYIDLHVHSTYSDGSYTPAELVDLAEKAGLSAFALTDHDTVKGFKEAQEAVKNKPSCQLEVIPGVEISAAFRKRDIHILGLLIDPENDTLNTELERARLERDTRNERMVAGLQKAGVQIDLDAIQAENKDSVITRAHFARYLVTTGQVKDYSSAFTRYLGDDTPYYIPRKFIEPKEAIQLILGAGGIPVLAHPLLYHLNDRELRELLDQLTGFGLCGIETIYSTYSHEDETYVRQLAGTYHLLMTGGSDFHGTPKPSIQIGVGHGNLRIPYELLEKLRAKS